MPNRKAVAVAEAEAAAVRLRELQQQREAAHAELARLEKDFQSLLVSPELTVETYRATQADVKRVRVLIYRIGSDISATEDLISALAPAGLPN